MLEIVILAGRVVALSLLAAGGILCLFSGVHDERRTFRWRNRRIPD